MINLFEQYYNEVIFEGFKEIYNKWSQDNDPDIVEYYIDRFKILKNRNIIRGEESDISPWHKKSFEEFKQFVDSKSKHTTKSQQKKEIAKDAIKVFENDKALVIQPLTHAASCKYGAGTQWCITSKNSMHWDQYIGSNVKFLFVILKDLKPYDKYAFAIYEHIKGSKPIIEIYDAEDTRISLNKIKPILNELNIPIKLFVNEWDPIKWVKSLPDAKQNPDGSWDVNGNVDLTEKKLTKLPIKFNHVTGFFSCSYNNLVTLEGSPKKVGGDFICHSNKLTSLQGAPTEVKYNFWCDNNQLTTLEGAPTIIKNNFDCNNNKLTTLKGAPKTVGGYFNCMGNKKSFTEQDIRNLVDVRGEIYTDDQF